MGARGVGKEAQVLADDRQKRDHCGLAMDRASHLSVGLHVAIKLHHSAQLGKGLERLLRDVAPGVGQGCRGHGGLEGGDDGKVRVEVIESEQVLGDLDELVDE